MFRDWRQPKYTGPERRKKKRWRPRPIRVLLVLLGMAALGYTLAALWLMTQETRMVFQAGSTLAAGRPPLPFEQIDLPRPDGARQFAWVMEQDEAAEEAPWVLFLHGNASTIASSVNLSHYARLRAIGCNLLAAEYRGFAGLEGVPTEDSLGADARAAYAYLRDARRIPARRIALYGWSLGGAVSVDLAARADAGALILEGTPTSMLALMRLRYPLFPLRLVLRNHFESIETIGRVRAPVLILHGNADEVVPISEGRALFEAAPEPKSFAELRGGHFDAIDRDADRAVEAIGSFLVRHGFLARSGK
jgi:fermentation-respiration switch protein FrsA (DUF1100 family)